MLLPASYLNIARAMRAFPRLDGSVNHHYKTIFYGKIRA
nr:MAG TPA: hypothetical protein [Caudoviricetes sp.]